MIRKLLWLLLLPLSANAGEVFYRANADTSVTLGDICVPEAAGVEIFALDFDTTNLTITISAQGDGVDQVFTYTSTNLDDYDATPPAWGNPTTSAIEVEAQSNGCVKLHIRDEVFAVSGATEWSIRFTDSTTDGIMDWVAQVLALGTSADITTAAETALTNQDIVDNTDLNARTLATADYATAATQATLTAAVGDVDEAVWNADPADFIDADTWGAAVNAMFGTDGAVLDSSETVTLADGGITTAKIATGAVDADALATDGAQEIRDSIMQYDLDNSISFEEAMCYALSILAGEANYTTGTTSSVFQDPTGTDNRVTVTYGTDNGDRTSVSLSATNCGSN